MILWFWDVKHFKIVIFIYLKILLANKMLTKIANKTECMLDHSLFFHNSMSTKTWHWYLTHLHLSPALLSSPAFLQLLQSELPSKPWYTHVLTSPSFRNTPNSVSSKCCFPDNLKIFTFQQQTPHLVIPLKLFLSCFSSHRPFLPLP